MLFGVFSCSKHCFWFLPEVLDSCYWWKWAQTTDQKFLWREKIMWTIENNFWATKSHHSSFLKTVDFFCVCIHFLFSEPQNISKREAKTDPIKTMKTPTTSIQFLWPGNIEALMVYCGISINTTAVQCITFTRVPEIYCKDQIQSTHIPTVAMQCKTTVTISMEPSGHTGTSTAKVNTKLLTIPKKNAQNKDLIISSPTQGYCCCTADWIEKQIPATAVRIYPSQVECWCGIWEKIPFTFCLFLFFTFIKYDMMKSSSYCVTPT